MLAGQPTALARHVLESATGTVHNTYRGFCTVGGEVEVHPMPLPRQLQNRARARALGMDLADHSSSPPPPSSSECCSRSPAMVNIAASPASIAAATVALCSRSSCK